MNTVALIMEIGIVVLIVAGTVLYFLASSVGIESLIVICLMPIIVFMLVFVLGKIVSWRKRYIKDSLIGADRNGLYPVHYKDLRDLTPDFIEIAKLNQVMKQPWVPSTYSPRTTNKKEESVLPELESAFSIPAFEQLPFRNGQILLGYEDDIPFYADINNLISTSVGGTSGSGKSNLMRFILFQYLKQGANIFIIDPHKESGEESLSECFEGICPISSLQTNDINDTLAYFETTIHNRLIGKDSDRQPLILVIDEFVALLNTDYRDKVIEVVNRIATESRKTKIFCYCISQQFHKDLVPSTLKNSFSNFISCKTRENVAKIQTGSNEFAKEVSRIKGFQAVFMDVRGTLKRFLVPECKEEEITRVAPLPSSLPKANNTPSTKSKTEEKGSDISESRKRRVLEMINNGSGISEIVTEVYGVKGGRNYKQYSNEVMEIIRQNLRM